MVEESTIRLGLGLTGLLVITGLIIYFVYQYENSNGGSMEQIGTGVGNVATAAGDVASVVGSAAKTSGSILNTATKTVDAVINSVPRASVAANCPKYYRNDGLTCHSDALSKPFTKKTVTYTCPSGMTNMGATCYRGPSSYYVGGYKTGTCKNGQTNLGGSCGLSKLDIKCPSGYHVSGALCYPNCTKGGSYDGTSRCNVAAKSINIYGANPNGCPSGMTQSKITPANCYDDCTSYNDDKRSVFYNNGTSCWLDGPRDMGLSSMSCPTSHPTRIAGICYANCASDRKPDATGLLCIKK